MRLDLGVSHNAEGLRIGSKFYVYLVLYIRLWLEITNFLKEILPYSKFITHNLTFLLRLGSVYVTYCS
jgi:hypothetical protein